MLPLLKAKCFAIKTTQTVSEYAIFSMSLRLYLEVQLYNRFRRESNDMETRSQTVIEIRLRVQAIRQIAGRLEIRH